jgi:hypothetical protein
MLYTLHSNFNGTALNGKNQPLKGRIYPVPVILMSGEKKGRPREMEPSCTVRVLRTDREKTMVRWCLKKQRYVIIGQYSPGKQNVQSPSCTYGI